MKKTSKIYALVIAGLLALSAFTGCNADTALTGTPAAAAEASEIAVSTAAAPVVGTYAPEDLDAGWDAGTAASITLQGSSASITGSGASAVGGAVTITQAGTYVLSGVLDNGQILVNAGKEDLVHLVLNGVTLSNAEGPVIYGLQSGKIVVTLAEGSINVLQDGSVYTLAEGEDEPDATLFSKDDLTLNGSGTLTVTGNAAHGIVSKDALIIAGGTLSVTAVADGIKGKDAVTVKTGTLTVQAGEDGIQASNDTEADKGWIILDGGTISVTAGDDGIHAETALTVNGGLIDIADSVEGLEGKSITVNGGDIRVKSSDDGLNGASGSAEEGARPGAAGEAADNGIFIRIAGGSVTVSAAGDGIDANGDLYFTGGTVVVNGPTTNGNGAMDYDGVCLVTGGTLAIAGSSGMAQSPGEASAQNSLTVIFSSVQGAGTPVSLTDDSGNVLVALTPEKAYQSVVFSSPVLEQGKTYSVNTGGTFSEAAVNGVLIKGTVTGSTVLTQVTLEKTVTRIADDGTAVTGGRGGQMPPRGEGKPGTWPEGSEAPEKPAQ